MDEHAEARFVPPLHAPSAVGILRRGTLLGLRLRAGRGCLGGGG